MTRTWDWSSLTGKVVLPCDLNYDMDRIDYNTRELRAPAALVFCQNVVDVRNAVNCVRTQGIPFRVRSGGHSYEEFSLMDDGLIIDISGLAEKRIDDSTCTARVGAGLSQQDMWKLLGATRTYAFPLGTMGGVGIAGVLQGGGIGMLTRAFGLALDRITSIQLVTAAGEIVEANAATHADLFWALRGGGGGNFGIVTAFSLLLVPLSEVVVYALSWPKKDFKSVMDYWQRWAPTLSDYGLTCQLTFSSDGSLHSEGVYLGSPDRLTELLRPWIDRCPPSRPLQMAPMSWYDSTTYFNSFDSQCPHPFKTTGAFVSEPLPPSALDTLEQAINDAPANVSCDIWMQSFGGAMTTTHVSANATAFAHRDAHFILEFGGSWMDRTNTATGQVAARWTRDLRLALAAHSSGAYVNFADRDLGSRSSGNLDYLDHYYGDHADRLRALKRVWDPENLFQFEQSIPLPTELSSHEMKPRRESSRPVSPSSEEVRMKVMLERSRPATTPCGCRQR